MVFNFSSQEMNFLYVQLKCAKRKKGAKMNLKEYQL